MEPIAGLQAVRGADLREAVAQLADVHQHLSDLRERQLRAVPQAAEELARFARTRTAPAELRALQRRVDAGELTWDQVVFGGGDDPDARAVRSTLSRALDALPAALRRAGELMEAEGLTPREAAERAVDEIHGEEGP